MDKAIRKVRVPDPQKLLLSALREACSNWIDLNAENPDEYCFLWDDEPKSHVFTGEDLEEGWGGDIDEAMEVVNMVGERDLDAKIRYWREILNDLNEGML